MPNGEGEPKEHEDSTDEQEFLRDDDFQYVLRELLNAYEPVLEEELERLRDPERLKEEARKEPDCDTEFELADRLFETFASEAVALRLLPEAGRRQLGPVDQWRWCLLHIRCCIIFGWLVCRGPRTFRGFLYYLYRYWLCVRRVLGTPVASPPTPEERQDFAVLVDAAARAYRPYLTDQLASVEFPLGLPDDVLDGRIDCFEGDDEAAAVFERLLTVDAAQALLGKAAFEQHRQSPIFWFCRCWCLCAIRFGCCLARARSFIDIVRCLIFYFRCLRRCFRPLRCDLTQPTGCVEEQINPQVGGMTVTVEGTAAGAFFSHYTIEWRLAQGDACGDDEGWTSDGVVYPGGGATGTSPVVAGTLGWINTTALGPDAYDVRVCVYSTQPGASPLCCCIQFRLFKKLVWIDHVAGAPVQTPPGPFVSSAPIVSGNPGGQVVPVGCCVTVKGSAFVGDCNNRRIKCFDLHYGIGFLPGPGEIGFNPAAYSGSLLTPFGPVCYTPPEESGKRAIWNRVIGRALTTRLVKTQIQIGNITIDVWKLHDFCFDSASQLPPCPDPQHACRSGKYTLLLDVEDTLGIHHYDTQHVWFDNKPIHAEFGGLEGLPGCEDLGLLQYVPPGAPCGTPWPINILGIAYDEYIDPADLTYPSDNFDFYSLWITRQGGPTYSVPITPDLVTLGPDPHKGTTRVGDPGTRCEQSIGGCLPPPVPPKFHGLLTKLDLRIFDAVCAASLAPPFAPPANFALQRGECCGYAFQLFTQDKTWSDSGVGICHRRLTPPWAVCICNDIDGRITERAPAANAADFGSFAGAPGATGSRQPG